MDIFQVFGKYDVKRKSSIVKCIFFVHNNQCVVGLYFYYNELYIIYNMSIECNKIMSNNISRLSVIVNLTNRQLISSVPLFCAQLDIRDFIII